MAELSKSPLKSVKTLGDVLNPTNNCAICLDKCTNESFVDPCLHKYCYSCLITWSKHSPVCPLCKRNFNKVIHNVRSLNDYDTTFVKPRRQKNLTLFRDMQNRRYYAFRPGADNSSESDDELSVNTSNMTAIRPVFRFYRSTPSTSGMTNPGGSAGSYSRVNILHTEVIEADVISNSNGSADNVSSIRNSPLSLEMYNMVTTDSDSSMQSNDDTAVMNTPTGVAENDVMTVYAPTNDSALSIIVNYDSPSDRASNSSRNVMDTNNPPASTRSVSVTRSSYSAYEGSVLSRFVNSFLQRTNTPFNATTTSGGRTDGVSPSGNGERNSVNTDAVPWLRFTARPMYRTARVLHDLNNNGENNHAYAAVSNTAPGTSSSPVIIQTETSSPQLSVPGTSTSSGSVVTNQSNPQNRYNLRKRTRRVSVNEAPPNKRNRKSK